MEITVTPIGVVRAPRREVRDDFWGDTVSRIELDATRFDTSCTQGLEEFSHIEVVFFLDRVKPEDIVWGARHPRGNPDWPVVGVFAMRAKARPNRIAVSRARLRRVDGLTLEVEGLDAIDGTPVLDIKPYIREFSPSEGVRQPRWATELMREYYAPGEEK